MLWHEKKEASHVREVKAETQSGMFRKRQRHGGQQYSYCTLLDSNSYARFQGRYAGRRVVEVPSMDTRTTYNLPVWKPAGVIVCDSPPRTSYMAGGTHTSAGSIRWPCESGHPTFLRGNL